MDPLFNNFEWIMAFEQPLLHLFKPKVHLIDIGYKYNYLFLQGCMGGCFLCVEGDDCGNLGKNESWSPYRKCRLKRFGD